MHAHLNTHSNTYTSIQTHSKTWVYFVRVFDFWPPFISVRLAKLNPAPSVCKWSLHLEIITKMPGQIVLRRSNVPTKTVVHQDLVCKQKQTSCVIVCWQDVDLWPQLVDKWLNVKKKMLSGALKLRATWRWMWMDYTCKQASNHNRLRTRTHTHI